MPRPRCCRRIAGAPCARMFKPAGQPAAAMEEVTLTLEEYEAIRLADFEALYQEDAAKRMGVSRQTFGRTITQARGKVARALVLGCVLRIEATEAEAEALNAKPDMRDFLCKACGHTWQEPFGTGRPAACPACKDGDFQRKGCTGSGSSCGHTQPADKP